MSRHHTRLRTHVRPMAGWWRRDRHFTRYMLRESSSVAIVAYAMWLLVGIASLVSGEAAFERWRTWQATPWSVGLHLLALVLIAYHAITWFQVMPKTLPGARIDTRMSRAGGVALNVVVILAALLAIGWVGR